MVLSERQKDIFSLVGILGAIICFFPNLILAKSGAITGDHWVQHYPWAYLMAETLKSGQFPFWTSKIVTGFPLAAESQIGLYYLPNILLYLTVPFKWAYSYSSVLHFIISGSGLYLYCRKIHMSSFGALFSAFAFLFGTAYGGAYYNITSLKTVCWLPWALWLTEKILESGKIRWAFCLSFIMGMSMVAGYLQVAALTWIFFLAMVCLRLFLFKDKFRWGTDFNKVVLLFLAGLLSLLIVLPQLSLTYELALFSNRLQPVEEYAYIGSLSPFALLTLINPAIQMLFRGNTIYIGMTSLIFLAVAFYHPKGREKTYFRLWVVLTLLALFLALGRWSPLYVGIIKLTQFYSFRVPAKFLVFICLGLAIIAGYGAHFLWQMKQEFKPFSVIQKATKFILVSVGVYAFFAGITFAVFKFARPLVQPVGEFLINKLIFGKAGHPHDYSFYLEKLNRYMDAILELYNLSNFRNYWPLLILFLLLVCVFFIRKKVLSPRVFCVTFLALLLIDLYGISFTDIKLDFARYSEMHKDSNLTRRVAQEVESGKLKRLYGFQSKETALPISPSANFFYGYEDIGGYSPLVLGRYHELIGHFGNVDDSNYQIHPDASFVLDRLSILKSLGVSHILSSKELSSKDLRQIYEENGFYLYEVLGDVSRAYFVRDYRVLQGWNDIKKAYLDESFDPRAMLLLERDENLSNKWQVSFTESLEVEIEENFEHDAQKVWKVKTNQPGFFVISESYYPGWQASVNGQEVPIYRAYGVFKAIWISEPGEHEIILDYQPSVLRYLQGVV